MMTKQDFVAIATALAEAEDLYDAHRKVADVCAESNPAFDRQRFYAHIAQVEQDALDAEMTTP